MNEILCTGWWYNESPVRSSRNRNPSMVTLMVIRCLCSPAARIAVFRSYPSMTREEQKWQQRKYCKKISYQWIQFAIPFSCQCVNLHPLHIPVMLLGTFDHHEPLLLPKSQLVLPWKWHRHQKSALDHSDLKIKRKQNKKQFRLFVHWWTAMNLRIFNKKRCTIGCIYACGMLWCLIKLLLSIKENLQWKKLSLKWMNEIIYIRNVSHIYF